MSDANVGGKVAELPAEVREAIESVIGEAAECYANESWQLGARVICDAIAPLWPKPAPLDAEVAAAVERLKSSECSRDGGKHRVVLSSDLRTVLAALAEAQRDRERLLDALQQIAITKPLCGLNPKAKVSDSQDMKLVWNVHAIARAAIEEAR